MNAEEISLGFMETERRVPRWFFPSKVGGLPVWQSAPPPTDLFCGVCTPQVPLTLLVQVPPMLPLMRVNACLLRGVAAAAAVAAVFAAAVLDLGIYAPIEGSPWCFHRSLYVFCCLSCGSHFRAVSSCLPRDNAEYPNCAVSTYFPDKDSFWRLWKQQQKTLNKSRAEDTGSSSSSGSGSNGGASSSSDSSSTCSSSNVASASSSAAAGAAGRLPEQLPHEQQPAEVTQTAVINQLQKGERLRHVCCCPVCGLAGGETIGETGRAAAVALLQQELQRSERRLEVLLRRQQQEAAAATAEGDEEEGNSSAVTDLDQEDFARENAEADQRGLLLLDAAHAQCVRVLHPRCLKRLKFGSVFVAFPEFPLCVETEEQEAKRHSKRTLDAALERLGLEGSGEELSHEEQLLRKYREAIRETPEADLDESEVDAFEEIHQKYTTEDPQLEVFLRRCGAEDVRGHVIRYALGGQALWPFSPNQLPPETVPNCCCGAKRQFEFQVQPQIISRLTQSVGETDPAATASLERLCFGLLAVFTCSAFCDSSMNACRGYREEFVYAQPDPFYG
ncbi:hypothetical protein Emag_002738 [Eimeria magna]